MSTALSNAAITRSVHDLEQWRQAVHSQKCKHLWQFLALKKSGVGTDSWISHSEAADFEFCDRHLRVREGDSPYYDPLDQSFRIASHPHSNLATARKNTFKNRWRAAATKSDDSDEWRFAPNYLEIFKLQVCSVAGSSTPIPLTALAIWLLRGEAWPANCSNTDVSDRFCRLFNISEAERIALFDETPPPWATAADVFVPAPNDLSTLPAALAQRMEEGSEGDTLATAKFGAVSPRRIAKLLRDGRGQLVLHGPPGTSKTFLAKQVVCELAGCSESELASMFLDPSMDEPELLSRSQARGGWVLVQFHPSYCYEDFVCGLSAIATEGSAPRFEVVDRTFAKLCRIAASVTTPIVLIIDEINRGDLSRILGELMYGLEYRGAPVATQYSSSGAAALVVPRNLYIVATLNTADKSIAHLDFALRRRFDFVHCGPDRSVVESYHGSRSLRQMACALFDLANNAVRNVQDYGIGHSYFLHPTDDGLATAFAFQVVPLLREYRAEDLLRTETISLDGIARESVDLFSADAFHLHAVLVDWMTSCSPNETP